MKNIYVCAICNNVLCVNLSPCICVIASHVILATLIHWLANTNTKACTIYSYLFGLGVQSIPCESRKVHI